MQSGDNSEKFDNPKELEISGLSLCTICSHVTYCRLSNALQWNLCKADFIFSGRPLLSEYQLESLNFLPTFMVRQIPAFSRHLYGNWQEADQLATYKEWPRIWTWEYQETNPAIMTGWGPEPRTSRFQHQHPKRLVHISSMLQAEYMFHCVSVKYLLTLICRV